MIPIEESIQYILTELKKLDLRTATETRVRDILNYFDLYALPCFHILKDSLLYRATILKPGERLTKSRLWYCPAEKNLTYQRATCKGKTALYVTSPAPMDENGEGNACELALHEIWNDAYWGKEQISVIFSKWRVTKDIYLGAIHYSSPENNSTRLNNCAQNFYGSLQDKSPQCLIQNLEDFYNFMNDEFEKPVDHNFDKDYLISACFADIIREKEINNDNHLDGLIWESHTVDNLRLGDALSAAIYSESVDTKLTLDAVFEDTFSISHIITRKDSKIIDIRNLK